MLGNVVQAAEELCAAQQRFVGDVEAQFHIRALFGWLASRAEEHHDVKGLHARLVLPDRWGHRALEQRAPRTAGAGLCHGILIDSDHSNKGFIVELVLHDAPGAEPAFSLSMGSSFRRSIRAAQTAVLQHLLASNQLDLPRTLRRGEHYTLQGPPAAETYLKEGHSMGAAAAVATVSRWCDLPVDEDLFITGGIDTSGAICAVDCLDEKVAAVLRERPHAKKVIVPRQELQDAGGVSECRISPVGTIAELLHEVFGPEQLQRSASRFTDIEGAVRKGVELYEKHNNFQAAEIVMRTALTAIDERRAGDTDAHRTDEFTALWRLGSSLVHRGKVQEATQVFQRAEDLGSRLWDARLLSPQAYLGYRNNRAVLLRDAYQYEEASACLEATLTLQHQMRQDRRELAKTLGNLGELWSIMGTYDRAEKALHESVDHLASSYTEELPRAYCNLGNLFLRQHDARRALVYYSRGIETNQHVEYGHHVNESFLRYGMARAELALGQAADAHATAAAGLKYCSSDSSYPRQLLLTCQGLSEMRRGHFDRGEELLLEAGDLTFVEGDLLRFGLATALGYLVIEILNTAQDYDEEATKTLTRQFTKTAQTVPGLRDAPRLKDEINALLEGLPLPRPALTEKLEELIRWFPYGIDPAGVTSGVDPLSRKAGSPTARCARC